VFGCFGCDYGVLQGIGSNTSAWPRRAARGEQVAIPIDTNIHPLVLQEHYDLSKDNIDIQIEWDTGSGPTQVLVTQGVRVIEAWAAPGTRGFSTGGGHPEARGWMAVAVFTLPGNPTIPDGLPYPLQAVVRPLRNGQTLPAVDPGTVLEADLEIVAGSVMEGPIMPAVSDLEPPPLLRLTGVAGPGHFDPIWFESGGGNRRVGSVEFELEHPSTTPPLNVFPASEAAAGTALIGPGSGANRKKVVLIHPTGFTLREIHSGQAGDGPFLDIAFAGNKTFQASQFQIWDLRVTDLDGQPLIEVSGNATAYFQRYARGAGQ
jgi:hypothetical protein